MSNNKQFPADTSLDYPTFLNDKKIDETLYSYLQLLSHVDPQGRTVVRKSQIPNQEELAEIIHVSSRPTVRTKFNYLKEHGYIIEHKKERVYELPLVEKCYFRLPTSLIKWFITNLTEQVIKVYIYLG